MRVAIVALSFAFLALCEEESAPTANGETAIQCERVQVSDTNLSLAAQESLKRCINNGSLPVSMVPFIVAGTYESPKNKIPVIFALEGGLRVVWFDSEETPEEFVEGETRTGPLVQAFKTVRKAYKSAQKFMGSAWNTATKPISSLFRARDETEVVTHH